MDAAIWMAGPVNGIVCCGQGRFRVRPRPLPATRVKKRAPSLGQLASDRFDGALGHFGDRLVQPHRPDCRPHVDFHSSQFAIMRGALEQSAARARTAHVHPRRSDRGSTTSRQRPKGSHSAAHHPRVMTRCAVIVGFMCSRYWERPTSISTTASSASRPFHGAAACAASPRNVNSAEIGRALDDAVVGAKSDRGCDRGMRHRCRRVGRRERKYGRLSSCSSADAPKIFSVPFSPKRSIA